MYYKIIFFYFIRSYMNYLEIRDVKSAEYLLFPNVVIKC